MHPLPRVLLAVGLSADLVAFVRRLMGGPDWHVRVTDRFCCRAAIRHIQQACATPLQVPGLVLLDMRPDMAGALSLVRWIRENEVCPWVPVVVICGDALLLHADSASRRGINGVVLCEHRSDPETSVIEKTCRFWLKINITATSGWAPARTRRARVGGCDGLPTPPKAAA
jgi:CheY-like chemotaxis protein